MRRSSVHLLQSVVPTRRAASVSGSIPGQRDPRALWSNLSGPGVRGQARPPPWTSARPCGTSSAMTEIRQPAEVKYQAELAALMMADKAPKPPGWRLSPRSVEAYVMGTDAPVGGVPITPKYIGDRSIVQVAIATLASDRALMLVGEPGTAKSWLSEHLAAAVS